MKIKLRKVKDDYDYECKYCAINTLWFLRDRFCNTCRIFERYEIADIPDIEFEIVED